VDLSYYRLYTDYIRTEVRHASNHPNKMSRFALIFAMLLFGCATKPLDPKPLDPKEQARVNAEVRDIKDYIEGKPL
jgi:hypothetical protein